MDSFVLAKTAVLEALGQPDKSKKGLVDKDAWDFIHTINSFEKLYTTSSCAGRITVFKEPVSGKKRDADWLFVSHKPADAQSILACLADLPLETLWFRCEPPIFHIACKDEDSAIALLKVCQANGFKRSGIISTGGRRRRQERFMVEIVGNERLDSPIAADGQFLMDKKYIVFLTSKANELLSTSRKKLEDLRKAIHEAKL